MNEKFALWLMLLTASIIYGLFFYVPHPEARNEPEEPSTKSAPARTAPTGATNTTATWPMGAGNKNVT